MRAPTVNLATRPFRNNTLYFVVFISCVVVLSMATGYNIHDYRGRGDDLHILKQQLTEGEDEYQKLFLDVEKMKKGISSVDLSLLSDKSSFVNGLILSRFFSWSQLFDRFEGLIPLDVRIRSIRPSISTKLIQLQIDGMAQKAVDLYEFEDRLGGSEYFSGVYPVSENTRESKNAINFQLVMNYLPSGKSDSEESPPTPTAGLPGSDEASTELADQQVESPAPLPGPSPVVTPVQTPQEELAPDKTEEVQTIAPGVQAGTPGTVENPPAEVPNAAGKPAASAVASGKPVGLGGRHNAVRRMTNKAFLDEIGEERFLKIRGRLVPTVPDEHPKTTNADFIVESGMEKFLKARGNLTGATQKAAVEGLAEGRKP